MSLKDIESMTKGIIVRSSTTTVEEDSSPYNICILNLTTKWNLDINIGMEGQQTQRMMRTVEV